MSVRALGIDVGGTTIKVCVADDAGNRLASTTVPTPRTVDGLVTTVAEQVAWGRREAAELAGIGVVVPGIVDDETGTAVLSVNLGWRDVPMRRLISEAVGEDVAFGHDVRAGATAEARWGAGSPDMLYVPIGTGIAAAVVLGGRPVVTGGYAGEIGQVLVADPATGRPVPLETVSSAASIARRDAERRSAGTVTDADLQGGARAVVERVRDGDPVARQVFTEAVGTLAEVLATTIGALGPVRIVVGGGLVGAGPLLLDALREEIGRRLVVAPVPQITAATLGSWSQALGAAAMGMGPAPS